MRQIKYIFINDSMPTAPRGKSSNICVNNLGHHYVINRGSSECNPSSLGDCRVASEVGNANSAGEVLKLIDVCRPGSFLERETKNLKPRERERLSQCSIGIKYNGSLKHETCNLKQRAALLRLLVDLRSHFPDAKILGLTELAPATRNFEPGIREVIRPSETMNQIRRALSDLP
jgi:hypothetical protein